MSQSVSFPQLPFTAKLATTLVPFMGWVMFAEFVIDRHGWDVALPFYRVGNFCLYDLAVLLALLVAWLVSEYRHEKSSGAKNDETNKDETADDGLSTRAIREAGACC